ncbi:uncharacterized protein LOC119432744 [Dermacentor silvarum]|uniref:uncharacterized protein LOC119432744 n=1 Tax=Dermacentor silvarum TaxID=543639 RepID=UPI00210184D6|nr:uncharacterized protein LOC119432744 [Dermacentor silvarum]
MMLPSWCQPSIDRGSLSATDTQMLGMVVFGFGRFQRFMLLCAQITVFASFSQSFAATGDLIPVDHWCHQGSEYANLSADAWKELYLPRRPGGRGYDSCHRYEAPLAAPASAATEDPDAGNSTRAVVACDAWDYDTSHTGSTVLVYWDIVCDRAWYGYLIQVAFMFGGALSVPFAGPGVQPLGPPACHVVLGVRSPVRMRRHLSGAHADGVRGSAIRRLGGRQRAGGGVFRAALRVDSHGSPRALLRSRHLLALGPGARVRGDGRVRGVQLARDPRESRGSCTVPGLDGIRDRRVSALAHRQPPLPRGPPCGSVGRRAERRRSRHRDRATGEGQRDASILPDSGKLGGFGRSRCCQRCSQSGTRHRHVQGGDAFELLPVARHAGPLLRSVRLLVHGERELLLP